MKRLKTLMLAGAVSALAITALGTPASAAVGKGTFAIINGIPGVKVDICINGFEIKSNVPYGGKVWKTRKAGYKHLKVYAADPRTCKGTRLAKRTFKLAARQPSVYTDDADLTLVVNKRNPKVIVFDNFQLGQIPPTGPDFLLAPFAWRHAADLGKVNLHLSQTLPESPVGPAAKPKWREGDEYRSAAGPAQSWSLRATRPEQTQTLARSKTVPLKAGRRVEWYLVGTNGKNARFVILNRAVSQPAP